MKTFALFATFLALPMLAGADACDTYCNTYCKNRGYDSGTCIRSQAVSKDKYSCSCTVTGGVPRQPDSNGIAQWRSGHPKGKLNYDPNTHSRSSSIGSHGGGGYVQCGHGQRRPD